MTSQLEFIQPPLGSQFKSYELSAASNYWTLDPYQYSITKFRYNFPDRTSEKINKDEPGLNYKNVDFEKLLPAYTAEKKSVNDFSAQSYPRFQANEGYFNPNEATDNSDLWYYNTNNGVSLNVQEAKHIIFPEPQRGGLNSQQLAKYSWTPSVSGNNLDKENLENMNKNCKFFNYNSNTETPFNQVYSFDSNYCREIGMMYPANGTMPDYTLNKNN